MKISLTWLKRYVPIEEDAATLARDLTMFGVNVEGIESLAPPFTGVVLGRVLEVKKHPGADRLSLCTVDAGGARPLGIVCGAPNVAAGMRVAVAVEGAVLAGGLRIKKSKIRGVVSEGMICSESELGLSENHSGIMSLDFDGKPGVSLEGKLGQSEYVFDLEVTPNRPDLLCHFGIAREIAALYRRKLVLPDRFELGAGGDFNLRIESGADCPRYTAAFVDDVIVAPSPAWMQNLLKSVGLGAINNIVDATNFVLMELGQPLHAFDRDTLAKDTIVVRRAKKGEKIVTLDGVERELDPGMLVIADDARPIAVAGVMGGRDTEVKAETKRLVIESAMFDPRLVRDARQRLKLETEASYRFEREADSGIMMDAAARACRLIQEMGAGTPSPACAESIHDPRSLERRTVSLRVSHANRVMGTELAGDDIAALLDRLELPSRSYGETVHVSIPTFRRDILEEIDLVEEAARVYGYENIGRDESARCSIFSEVPAEDLRKSSLVDFLVSRGFAEVVTSSFMDPADAGRMGWDGRDERAGPLRVANPLTEAQSALRTSLIPGLLGVVRRNTRAEQEEIRIFELGKVFLPGPERAGLPREELHIGALFARHATPLEWMAPRRQSDFFDMKGELEALLDRLGLLEEVKMMKPHDGKGQIFQWLLGGAVLAEGGLIAKGVSEGFDVDSPIFYFDLRLDELPPAGGGWPRFEAMSQYPAVKRDLCIVVADRVRYAEVRNIIMQQAQYLDSIRVFDYYRGGHLGEGKRSYTFRLSFRSSENTLDSIAVDREVHRIVGALQRELGAALRTE
ncbi:MAG: phenylalanine--tRNA ligase subunit beta [Candidatus Krumholzibacteria bacterium]|nr:phenylalanine--tRNA ligase subunit beta [Candidatus Krumholzibacteria bacterium]